MRQQDIHSRCRGDFEFKVQQAVRKVQAVRRLTQEDRDPCFVLPGLFIGSVGAARNAQALHREGITHILNASPLVPCLYRRQFRYKVIEVYDDAQEDIAQHFEETNRYISKARRKGGVLVHCYAGMSRSATFILAYLLSEHFGLDEALRLLKASRPCINPNTGFMMQLSTYSLELEERRCLAALSELPLIGTSYADLLQLCSVSAQPQADNPQNDSELAMVVA